MTELYNIAWNPGFSTEQTLPIQLKTAHFGLRAALATRAPEPERTLGVLPRALRMPAIIEPALLSGGRPFAFRPTPKEGIGGFFPRPTKLSSMAIDPLLVQRCPNLFRYTPVKYNN
eukprot:SAG31_NODE_8600_length_1422_cov_1.841270_1_plen_116_part_00